MTIFTEVIWVRYHDPWTEDRLQICRAANCATGPSEYTYMYVYVCACSSVCALNGVLSVRACIVATNGLTEDGGMGGFKCVHVCACAIAWACVRPCLRACDPVCEDKIHRC